MNRTVDSFDEAAGVRRPKPFKNTFADKVPIWIEEMVRQGKSREEITAFLESKTERYVHKWGNSSKVGDLLKGTKIYVEEPKHG